MGDHLIPMNKTSLGLEGWGNLVPTCADCNSVKYDGDWVEFLHGVAEENLIERKALIGGFIVKYDCVPSLDSIGLAVAELR